MTNFQQGEFDLIKRYFTRSNRSPRRDVKLSIGDDCAITEVQANRYLATTTDTLVVGTHFFADIDPADLAYKAVAVNLSDLAAMGAEPAWISLALTLPNVQPHWLERFSQSLFAILDHYNVNLIGGDTTKGDLSLTLTAQGLVTKEKTLYRHTAQVGDWIYVSGSLGDSAAGLQILQKQPALLSSTTAREKLNPAERYLLQRHLRPTPRVLLGLHLAGVASAAIDISDGLLADLGHILANSHCGAVLWLDQLPLSPQLCQLYDKATAEQFALSGGEDYELCFTVPDAQKARLDNLLQPTQTPYRCIGQIRSNQQLVLLRDGKSVKLPTKQGFDHFK